MNQIRSFQDDVVPSRLYVCRVTDVTGINFGTHGKNVLYSESDINTIFALFTVESHSKMSINNVGIA